MKYLREVNGHKIVCQESDDTVIDNHTFLKNYCLDEEICKGCPQYAKTNNESVWICKKYSTVEQIKTVKVAGKWKYEENYIGGRLHKGMRIPKHCERSFEHTIITQEMDKIKE